MRGIHILCVLLLVPGTLRARSGIADPLEHALAATERDTARAALLASLYEAHMGDAAWTAACEERLVPLLDSLDRSPIPAVRASAARSRAVLLYAMGYHLTGVSNYSAALRHFRDAWERINDPTPEESLRHYRHLQRFYGFLGDSARMAEYAHKVITSGFAAHDTAAVIGSMLSVAGWDPQAIRMDSIERLGKAYFRSADELAFFRWQVGWTLVSQRRSLEAKERLKEAIRLHGDAPPTTTFALMHWTLGEVYGGLDSLEQGIATLREAIRLSEATGVLKWIGRQRAMLGELLVRSGRDREAELTLQQAIEELHADQRVEFEVGAVRTLRDLYEREGRYKEALRTTDRWLVLKDSVAAMNASKETLLMEFDEEMEADSLASARILREEQLKAETGIARERARRNVFLVAGIGLLVFGAIVFRQRGRIRKALQRSDELLLNILPAAVAEELKVKGSAEAVHIDQVTVLFTDFKGFTAMSEQLSPKALVQDLHECFSAFDNICEKRGIEKIKTIGDAYMAAGGLPTPNTTHATDVIQAALEMRDFIEAGKARKVAAGLPYFEIRIGVHTGPVVAGIVGVKKFSYDIWGDTVNTASRMESSGEVGQVNISEATYRLVAGSRLSVVGGGNGSLPTDNEQQTTGPAFTFTPRGKVQAKGKGELEMYFVERGAGS